MVWPTTHDETAMGQSYPYPCICHGTDLSYSSYDNHDEEFSTDEEQDLLPIANDMRSMTRSERKKRGVRSKMAKASRKRNRAA